jgi:hypothetical protein
VVADGGEGCGFLARCARSRPDCRPAVPRMVPVGGDGGHRVRCVLHG